MDRQTVRPKPGWLGVCGFIFGVGAVSNVVAEHELEQMLI